MMCIIILAAFLVWLVCGVFAYGLTFAYFQRKYSILAEEDEWKDRIFALIMGAMGPFGLLTALIKGSIKYGLKF